LGIGSGLSASGKHSIAALLAKNYTERHTTEHFVNDETIIEWVPTVGVKDQLAHERLGKLENGIYESAELTSLGYLKYLLKLAEFTNKPPQEKTNIVTTWGALSTWNLMAQHFGGEDIQSFIKQHKLRDALWQTNTLTELTTSFGPDLQQEGLEIITRISANLREKTSLGLCPLIDTPRGIIVVTGQSIEACERNRMKPNNPLRKIPRRWEDIGEALQLQIRLVDSLVLQLCPDNSIALDIADSNDFAQKAALEIETKCKSIFSRYRQQTD
jgi:hypothetical protein